MNDLVEISAMVINATVGQLTSLLMHSRAKTEVSLGSPMTLPVGVFNTHEFGEERLEKHISYGCTTLSLSVACMFCDTELHCWLHDYTHAAVRTLHTITYHNYFTII